MFPVSLLYFIRKNAVSVICLALAAYFSYNIACGERSYSRLKAIEATDAQLSIQRDTVVAERKKIEDKVIRMRENTLDVDLLEERVNHILGYSGKGDIVLFGEK